MVLKRACAARGERAMSKNDQEDLCWGPTKDPRKSRLTMEMQQPAKLGFETPGLVWVKCPFPLVALGLEAELKAAGHVYCGQEAPVKNAPSSVIYCPDGEDVACEVERLRREFGNAPILVLGLRVDPQVARMALVAGADGFVHLGMQPAQIVHALSAAIEGKTVVSRDLLEAFLTEMVSWSGPLALTYRQREFLELVCEATPFNEDIVVPKELLQEFLVEEEYRLEELFRI